MGVYVWEGERIEGLHSKNRLLGQIVQKALRPSAQIEIITHNTDLFAFGCLDAYSCGRMDKHVPENILYISIENIPYFLV